MSESQPPRPSVRPAVALAFCLVGYVALVIAGLGLASLATDSDVISAPGIGQSPGAVGMLAAAAAFAGVLWWVIRLRHPAFGSVVFVIAATYVAYVIVTGLAVTIEAADIAAGLAVAGRLAIGWPGAVVAAAALVAGWAGIALVRTRAGRPRWPWERRGD
ncbi:MAG: hypothetical protein QM626_05010 [Microbacterium sp.]|uniref:hypothetical protein n=1 Tax=Microbacterium sp. TaxID=51671 RepID=UPI0039E7051C